MDPKQALTEQTTKIISNKWKTADFDRWLCMDAGTTFGDLFEEKFHKGRDHGRTLIYNIQCLLRTKHDYKIQEIIEYIISYILKLDLQEKEKENPVITHGFSYFS